MKVSDEVKQSIDGQEGKADSFLTRLANLPNTARVLIGAAAILAAVMIILWLVR